MWGRVFVPVQSSAARLRARTLCVVASGPSVRAEALSRGTGFKSEESSLERLDDDVLRTADRVGRARSLVVPGWSDRKDVQLAGTLTDGVQVVVVVPEHLGDGIAGQQAGVMGDGAGSVDVGDLQTFLAPNCQDLAIERHLNVMWGRDQIRGHIRVLIGCFQVLVCVRVKVRQLQPSWRAARRF